MSDIYNNSDKKCEINLFSILSTFSPYRSNVALNSTALSSVPS
jgi:hypothetical protein